MASERLEASVDKEVRDGPMERNFHVMLRRDYIDASMGGANAGPAVRTFVKTFILIF